MQQQYDDYVRVYTEGVHVRCLPGRMKNLQERLAIMASQGRHETVAKMQQSLDRMQERLDRYFHS